MQNNSSDCGVFMLQYVESLLAVSGHVSPFPMSNCCILLHSVQRMEQGLSYPDTEEGWGLYEKIGIKRQEIKELIMSLSQGNNTGETES